VFFPDDHLTWIPFAIRSALAVHRRQPVDAIMSTSPPISGHLVAGIVSRRIRRPWIADFRDPWIGNAFLPPLPASHRRAQAWLERWIVRNAARVVTAMPTLTSLLQQRYPAHAERIVTITNGYDAAELSVVAPSPRDDRRFKIVYSGSVYGGVLETFLAGLERLLDEDPAARERLRIEFVGWLDSESDATARRHLARAGVAGVVTFSGYRPRVEALATAAAADAALYLLAADPGKEMFIGGKLFEYVGLGLPIFAVAPPGDARGVLERLGWGLVAEPTVEGVADGLRRLLDTRPARGIADPAGLYDRRRLAGRLGDLLNEVVEGRWDRDH